MKSQISLRKRAINYQDGALKQQQQKLDANKDLAKWSDNEN